LARQDAIGFVLSGLVRAQAGERARTNAFTSAESARLAELEGFRSAAEKEYLASLPQSCNGRDCEERFAYYRCTGAYEFSSAFYRAVFDRFFTPDQQKALAPSLATTGTVWQGALAMAPNSHPFDGFPAPSRDCTGGTSAAPATIASGAATGANAAAAAANAQSVQATPSDDSIRRARAAGVDVTVFGLTLGEPLHLPTCPEPSFFDTPVIETTCIANDNATAINNQLGVPNPAVPFTILISMVTSKCPNWVGNCNLVAHLSGGRLTAVQFWTTGQTVQDTVGAALTDKYKKPTQTSHKTWENDAGVKIDSLNMTWNLPGLNVTFVGYPGGDRTAFGTVLIETDAVTGERVQAEKAEQDQKQKL
jgi:hypothetical protein